MFDVWWVDDWDDGIDEPRAEAHRQHGAASLDDALALAEAAANVLALTVGRGELVVLDERGRRVGHRIAVRDMVLAAA